MGPWEIRWVILKLLSMINLLSISYKIAFRWMPPDPVDDYSTELPRSMSIYGITKPQSIDPSHKSHDALVPYPTMQHFVAELCTCVHFCYKMLHCGIFVWCIVGFVRWVYWSWLAGNLLKHNIHILLLLFCQFFQSLLIWTWFQFQNKPINVKLIDVNHIIKAYW